MPAATAPANAGSEWQGQVGERWASEWQRTDRSFAELTPHLIDAATARLDAAAMVVDIGCGAGETLVALATRRPDVKLTGVDVAPALLSVAARRLAQVGATTALVNADAARWTPASPLDAAISRHGVMFFDHPMAALANIRSALTPGATFSFTCFRERAANPWATLLAGASSPSSDAYQPGPFAFADRAFVTTLLTQAGWRAVAATAIDYRYHAGDDIDDALAFFIRIGPAAPPLRNADTAARAVMIAQLCAAIAPYVTPEGVVLPAAAWLWQAIA